MMSKRSSSKNDTPEVPPERAQDDRRPDPNIIPPEDVELLLKLGMAIGNRVKRGKYGVVFEGLFTEAFSLDKLNRPEENQLHWSFVRNDPNMLRDMTTGAKFAIKFCDIETRKAYNVTDVEQRIQQEVNFIRRVSYDSATSVVRIYGTFATMNAVKNSKPTRYFILMELADDNLQCVIAANQRLNHLLSPEHVLQIYETLLSTIKSLHQQKLTYGSMRTSNILVFNNKTQPQVPFKIKIGDFVRSSDLASPELSPAAADEAIEEDLDDLYYIHAELFALSRFDFGQYQAFKESLKLLTDIQAHRNSIGTLMKVLELLHNFSRAQQTQAN